MEVQSETFLSRWDSEKEEQEVGLLGRRSRSSARQEKIVTSQDNEIVKTSGSSSSSSSSGDSVAEVVQSRAVGDFHRSSVNSEKGKVSLAGTGMLHGAESEASSIRAKKKSNGPDGYNGKINEISADDAERSQFPVSGLSSGQTPKEQQNVTRLGIDPCNDKNEEVDLETTDMKVEKVLAEQKTHDLYCPDCGSCITRKVILVRKRKRLDGDLPGGKKHGAEAPPETPTLRPGSVPDTEREAFRCLSCFSIFFPTAHGFKLVRGPGDDDQDAGPGDADTKKWWLSVFTVCSKETPPPPAPGSSSDAASSSSSEKQAGEEKKQDLPQKGISNDTVTIFGGAFDADGGKPGGSKFSLRPMPGVSAGDKPPSQDGSEETKEDTKAPLSKGPSEGTAQHDQVEVVVDQPGDSTGTTLPRVVTEGRGVEILKSVVYGGLAESVTSLGVVSSAAGSGSSTLNILVLGLANLVGGLFVIAQNLRDLKAESTGVSGEQEDRYRKLLGRREHFWLHAFLAILSYVLFGLVPPAVYGFSFRESDNRDYKAIAVFAASAACIVLLSIAKSYSERATLKAYVTGMTYYATVAVASSGVSYAVGNVLGELVRKSGWFDWVPNSGPVLTVDGGAWPEFGFVSS